MDDLVETVGKIGDSLGMVWALFQDESGQLTLPAMILLAGIALATAYRCAQETLPAREENHSSVLAVGSAITLVFSGVGIFFLVQIFNSLTS